MRPTPLLTTLVSLIFLGLSSTHIAAQSTPKLKPAASPASPKPSDPPPTARELPVRQVILYKNGVGYFEHLGQVTNNQRVSIDFTSSQLNDVLQSLTVLDDNGGHIAGINYNSTTPLAEQLKSISLAMSDDPTSTELFQALRGARVEVSGAPGGSITGRLMSIESRASTPNPNPGSDAEAKPIQNRFYLTVVGNTGAVRVIELTPTLSVRPLDPGLQSQLDRYLELLSSTHSTGLRHLTLDALGSGPRQLRVSYISEIPVWKSTYRIVFPNTENSAILQGWAVVDNTIGSDWDNVQLSLVAGAPQSFIQPLSDPLYLRRPEVPISTEALTTPQTHEAAEMKAPPPVPSAPMAAAETVTVEASPVGGPVTMRNQDLSGSRSLGSAAMQGMGTGFGRGTGGNVGGGLFHAGAGVSDTDVESNISTNAFDDFFQYRLAQPVTIHKNESAMVPILQQTLPVERVTLWSETETRPLRALWLENTSKLTFDNGNFSVFESGAFAGEGLLDPIHPGEKRLLSYAADQAVRVRPAHEATDRVLREVKIDHDGLIQKKYGVRSKRTLSVSNSAEEPRTVVLEIARRPGRDLSPEDKPAETAATLYRFRLAVPAHQSASQTVTDEGTELQQWRIDPNSDQVNSLEALAAEAPGLADQLKPVLAAEQQIRQYKADLKKLEEKTATLTADEARARENLTALKGNDAGKRFVDELNQAEDNLQSTRKETADLTEKVKAATESLRQTLLTLTIEWRRQTS